MTVDQEPLDVTQIRMVVFDVDGTIGDTADLVPSRQRRKPDDILKLLDPSAVSLTRLRLKNIGQLTSAFNKCGIRVCVISNAPAAYVGTMCFLAGINADTIIASNSHPELATKMDRLRWLAKSRFKNNSGISLNQVLYVGDLPDDFEAARNAGCHFLNVDTYLNDPNGSTLLSRLDKLCEEIVSGAEPLENLNLNWHIGFLESRNETQQEILTGLIEGRYHINLDGPEIVGF